MQFRTRAIHVGQQRSVNRRHRAAHSSGRDVCAAGSRRIGRIRLLAQWQSTRKASSKRSPLEGGCGALAFASGMAATHCVTMLLGHGDHIVAGSDI